MKIGSVEWLKRERDWLHDDILSQLALIESLKAVKTEKAELLIDQERRKLFRLRSALKQLRENPGEYVRRQKEDLS